LPLIIIYLLADVGSVVGGWLSSALIKRGWSINRARKITLLIAAVAIVPTMLAPSAPNLAVTVSIVGLAAAAHQWWVLVLEGILGIVFGVLAILYPGITLVTLAYLFAAWAIVSGAFQLVEGWRVAEHRGRSCRSR
jgi:hypothetical protein